MNRLVIALTLALAAIACEPQRPVESAGERVDETVDQISEAARDARDEAEDFGEDVANRVEEARE